MEKPGEQLTTEILPPTGDNLRRAAKMIRAGELVGLPTETVYGLAGNAFLPEALALIFAMKERPRFDPLILHVHSSAGSLEDLTHMQLVDDALLSPRQSELIQQLMDEFWPGPLTLILPKHKKVPELATSGLPSVGVRMPRHPVAQDLIQKAQVPLAAPSANRFGRISPTSSQAVYNELGGKISLILEGGNCVMGIESTIIGIGGVSDDVSLFRPGATSKEEIERVLGFKLKAPENKGIVAPGMTDKHYAPEKRFHLLSGQNPNELSEILAQYPKDSAIAYLAWTGDLTQLNEEFEHRYRRRLSMSVLTPKDDPLEAAQNLFAELRKLDQLPVQAIIGEPCPSTSGLGLAIADRLRRASFS